MKRVLFHFSLLFQILIIPSSLHSQDGRLAAFNAVRIDKDNVEVLWTLKANVSCQSPQVQRSVDGKLFSTIYVYPGVCGGSQIEESYKWIDKNALSDKDSYYRLRIDDGEYSQIDLIERDLILNEEDVFLFPNPSSGQSTLHYDPALGGFFSLKVFNKSGQEELALLDGFIQTNRGVAILDLDGLSNGMYFIQIDFKKGVQRNIKIIIDR